MSSRDFVFFVRRQSMSGRWYSRSFRDVLMDSSRRSEWSGYWILHRLCGPYEHQRSWQWSPVARQSETSESSWIWETWHRSIPTRRLSQHEDCHNTNPSGEIGGFHCHVGRGRFDFSQHYSLYWSISSGTRRSDVSRKTSNRQKISWKERRSAWSQTPRRLRRSKRISICTPSSWSPQRNVSSIWDRRLVPRASWRSTSLCAAHSSQVAELPSTPHVWTGSPWTERRATRKPSTRNWRTVPWWSSPLKTAVDGVTSAWVSWSLLGMRQSRCSVPRSGRQDVDGPACWRSLAVARLRLPLRLEGTVFDGVDCVSPDLIDLFESGAETDDHLFLRVTRHCVVIADCSFLPSGKFIYERFDSLHSVGKYFVYQSIVSVIIRFIYTTNYLFRDHPHNLSI